MKVFAYGYSSGHGDIEESCREVLERRSDMMLRALVADLGSHPDIQILTLRAPRAAALDLPASVLVVPDGRSFGQSFNDCVMLADAVWLIAPETAGLLEQLSRKVLRRKRVLLGSRPAAVHVAASKMLTARALARAGIPVIATYAADEVGQGNGDAWVVKPDDGAGCLDTRIFCDAGTARDWVAAHGDGHVMQPFVPGRSCSLSLLCRNGAAQVLSINEHRVAVRNDHFHDLGCTVNSVDDGDGAWTLLANRIARVMPGLWGYVGVDFIMTRQGPLVLEVNPRLTTSYIGLHAATGCNPAALVMGLMDGAPAVVMPPFRPGAVSVETDVLAAQA